MFLVAPGLLALVDLPPASATARSDVRALFGGLELGVGLTLAACARRPTWWRPGLLLQATAFGGLALGRAVSLAVDGMPRPITFALWLPEVAGCVAAVVAWRRGAGGDPRAAA